MLDLKKILFKNQTDDSILDFDVHWAEKNNYDFFSLIKKEDVKWESDTNRLNTKISNLKDLRNLLAHKLNFKKNENQSTEMLCSNFLIIEDFLCLEIVVVVKTKNKIKYKICRIKKNILFEKMKNYFHSLIDKKAQWNL